MLPLSRSGNTNTLARPATGEPGALRAATSATSAASPCSSPSHTKSGRRAWRRDTACRTRSTRPPAALPRVLYERNATTGSSPTIRRRSRAAAAPASASCARRVVSWHPARRAGAEMLYEAGDGGRGQGPPQHFDYPETTRLQLRRRRAHPRVVALGEHDVLPRAARPFIDAVAEAHRPNFWCNAWRTAGWTSCDTSPPNRATSRTRLDER